jgi:hypothetical protein
MTEKEDVYSTKIKYNGIFNFRTFYKFCYDWLVDETGISNLGEIKYAEKLTGTQKDVDFEWKGSVKFDDYFKKEYVITFKIIAIAPVEITQGGAKIQTNKGALEMKVKGTIVTDYDGRYDSSSFRKFLRDIYDKWIVGKTKDRVEDKIVEDCNEFVEQAKAYLDLEGKK